ncbi:MAG: sigma-54-dependent Fis family transcriptional regulator [Rhodocyclaceae bacterium]|nr:sigma-54-dependent Fis family transcriptional regulator [Rhodocyclaceae bacterium]
MLRRALEAASAVDARLGSQAMAARLAESQTRSRFDHRLDPWGQPAEEVLTDSRLARLRERHARFLRTATPGVDWLHRQIGGLGYCTLLTDGCGATLEVWTKPSLGRDFGECGLLAGACWSEQAQGTCGVGTAIAAEAPVLVHREDHFLALNHAISCSAVPVFGADGRLQGVINATAMQPPSERSGQALAYNLTLQTALRIEQALFREGHADAWIAQVRTRGGAWDGDPDALIAFDEDGRIRAISRQLALQLTAPVDHVEALLDLPVARLIDFAHRQPGVPMPLLGGPDNCISVMLRAPAMPGRNAGRPVAVRRPDGETDLAGLCTSDPRLRQSFERIKLLANNRIPILLLGETGSGKEAMARAIHGFSARADKPFVAINCAAIPESLIESELFGYREGAFTGARAKGCPGKIAMADGGTLFLDEIGDMPLSLQTRLLRVLSEGEVVALGAIEPVRVDISVVCATHRDLPAMVADGSFREDLYYRLNAATFRLPPLRERTDVRELVARVFGEECEAAGRSLALSRETTDTLCRHAWPGNIRELRNVLRFAIAICTGEVVGTEHLPEGFGAPPLRSGGPVTESPPPLRCGDPRKQILDALEDVHWNVTAACRLLGVSRSTFYRRVGELDIQIERPPAS